MNILILGAYCSCNLGDAVICQCVADLLQKRFPQAQITICDVVNRTRTTPRREPDAAVLEKNRKEDRKIRLISRWTFFDKLLRRERWRVEKQNRTHLEQVCQTPCDLVIFAGGQMFMDRYALFLEFCVERFAQRGIPVFFNACGTGPDDSRAIRKRLKKTLSSSNVVHISCRDDVERVNRRYLKAGRTAVPTFDPALLTGQTYGITKAENADTIGLGVIYPNFVDPQKALKLWQDIIRQLERQGKRWQFFSNGDPADIVFARQVIASMPELQGREAELILPWDRQPEELVAHIAGYKSLVAYRLHSNIIACSLDIPSVALVWDDKLPRFFEKIGHPERCFSVDAKAEDVLRALERAEQEGYDRSLIEQQAAASARQLTDAILTQFPEWREDS